MRTTDQVLEELAIYIKYTAFQIKGRVTTAGPLNFTEEILYKIKELMTEQKQVGDDRQL